MKSPIAYARAELLVDGLYGATIIDNQVREFACIVVKLRQRDIKVAGDMLVASAAQGGKGTGKIMETYMNTIYTENKSYMKSHDDAMRKQLDELSKIKWGEVLSVSPLGMDIKKGRIMPKEGDKIEDFI